MAAVLVWVLIVATVALAIGTLVALVFTLLGLRRHLQGETK